MDWGDVPTFAATVVSLAALGFTIWQARGAKASAREAGDQARRAVAANERTAAALERQNELTEKELAKYPNPWRLFTIQDDKYALLNKGSQREYGVELECDSSDFIPVERQDVDPDSRIEFWVPRTMGSVGDGRVTVTWHHRQDQSDERLTWSHPLPS